MNKFVRIGQDMINLDAVSSINFVENQSGISDRIIIYVGESSVTVDSAIGGKARMEAIREKLLKALDPSVWDEAVVATEPDPLLIRSKAA